ncbi:hypothetical protein Ahy_B10g103198 [Arachis hypogaea]|uniref:PB1-like domain-containing protein n=1 Tax=Arachis hypogaea TaxID=3818 RepID=A0A444X3F9_ARAHY|nr:hypothetical protein Ahy_B10g103198 [Arachis hypogaea]
MLQESVRKDGNPFNTTIIPSPPVTATPPAAPPATIIPFRHLNGIFASQTGLELKEQRLIFRGKEKEDEECLHMEGVKDMSKMEGSPMTFIFHHGGLFRTGEDGDMVYEPDNTEVLMGVEGDTLDVFFVRGYYKELGYIEAGNLDNIGEGVALLEAGSSKKKKFSSQAKMHHSQPMKTPTVNHPQPKKPTSDPTKAASQPNRPKAQPTKNPESNNKKGNTNACRVTRSRRTIREGPIQDEDSDSHDSYESTEDELYKPPKVLGDNLYSSDSDSDSRKGSQRKQKQAEAKEKHRLPKSRLADKEIDTADSSYEGFKDEESSESGKL